MRIISTLGFLAFAWSVSGQQFVEKQTILLPDSVTALSPSVIDINNDGLPDLALLVETVEGKNYLMRVAGDTLNPMMLANTSLQVPEFKSYVWYDYDNDNQLDLVASTQTSENAIVLINQGNFLFSTVATSIPRFEVIHFADMDSDGSDECILSTSQGGDYITKTLKRGPASGWSVTHDTLTARLSSIVGADFNNDGFRDLFISGSDSQTDSVFSRLLFYKEGQFVKAAEINSETEATLADVNHDGFMDLSAFGKTFKGKLNHFIFQGGNDGIAIVDVSDNVSLRQSFRSDFTSDGKVDEISFAVAPPDSANVLRSHAGFSEVLPHKHLLQQVLVDLEHDGDLDLIQITKHEQFSLNYLVNRAEPRNDVPQGPKHGIAVPIYNHRFFYWERATDDHTLSNSLTYDFYLESDEANIPSEFDLLNGKRLSISHGNNGVSNFRLVRDFSSSSFNYAIQSVDNALHAGPEGVCIGAGVACVQIEEEFAAVCTDERIKLEAPFAVHWFSLAKGHLGDGVTMDMPITASDTLFYIAPDYQGCTKVKLFPVKVNDVAEQTSETLAVCEGAPANLAAPGGWTTVTWSSASAGELGAGPSIAITFEADETIIASYKKSEECTYQKKYHIQLSRPVLVVQPASAKITPGGRVALSVTGADRYEWSPSATLSNADEPNTIASPLETTKYIVTGFDSINCTATAEVTVFVENAAGFVPSLFTPNADGTNDELKVYGLNDVNDFIWKIYNREGNVVFSTRSVSEASASGWDGTANGVRQPNGVYFWKVEGSRRNGELLLNGKKEGSFLLIR